MFDKIAKVQLLILSFVLGICLVFSACVISRNFSKDEISVTGTASEIVKSDSGFLKIQIKASNKDRKTAYMELKKAQPVVVEFLKASGAKVSDIEFLTIRDYPMYRFTQNGSSTQDVLSYNFEQEVSITSNDVNLIKKISLEAPSLAEKGIYVVAFDPSYYYSKLAEKKSELLQKATADAKTRASGMLKATHNGVGKMRSVKMGVFQITSPNSNEVSDWGINDASTIDKKVTAVANVVFSIR